MPALSVITINYNNRHGLADTFASVLGQQESNFEWIVIDGGSHDGSRELIEEHAARISQWISGKDGGIYDAMNKGIRLATGDFLIFLNSGDCFNAADTLQKCLDHLSASPDADILYADILLVTDPDLPPELYTHPANLRLGYFKKDVLNQQASLIRASLFRELGGFPDRYGIAGDYWLYVKAFVAGKKFVHMNFVMVLYDFTGVSMVSKNTYLSEMNLIWNDEVPEPQRRKIDRIHNFKKSRIGRNLIRLAEKLNMLDTRT